jgi:hypothetical protein
MDDQEEAQRAARREQARPGDAEAAARIAELEAALNEQRQLLRRMEEERNLERALRNGTYYLPIDRVFGIDAVHCTVDHFNAMFRPAVPTMSERGYQTNHYFRTRYIRSFNAADNANNLATGHLTTVNSSIPDARNVFPTTVFGDVNFQADLAHLVPASATNAGMYGDVARWVFGLGDEDADGEVIQKLIHGCAPPNRTGGVGPRIVGTGLKHFATNRIRLPWQAQFFDGKPCIFIIPVMTLDAVLNWNGGPYSAIFLAGRFPWNPQAVEEVAVELVYENTMRRRMPLASRNQVRTAGDLLRATILGLAYSYLFRQDQVLAAAAGNTVAAYNTLHDENEILNPPGVLHNTPNAMTGEGVIVPRLLDLPEGAHIGLVEFSGHEVNDGHPAPDPMLLVIKTAANWSWRHGQKLIAAGERPEEEDELDTMEIEAFHAFREDSYRAHSIEELAIGLHQWPGGVAAD